MNQRRGEGLIVPLEVVPFPNGDDPTHPPVSRRISSNDGYALISDLISIT